jgi:hypothetical protein
MVVQNRPEHRFIQYAEDENDAVDYQEEKRPLNYWDTLRASDIPFKTGKDSALFRLTDDATREIGESAVLRISIHTRKHYRMAHERPTNR